MGPSYGCFGGEWDGGMVENPMLPKPILRTLCLGPISTLPLFLGPKSHTCYIPRPEHYPPSYEFEHPEEALCHGAQASSAVGPFPAELDPDKAQGESHGAARWRVHDPEHLPHL